MQRGRYGSSGKNNFRSQRTRPIRGIGQVYQRADKGGKLIELLRHLDVSDRGSMGFKGDFRQRERLLRIDRHDSSSSGPINLFFHAISLLLRSYIPVR
jgi:hypothetical protein